MKNRGWQGNPPADDAEARERIITAAMRCLDRYGPTKTGLSDVATELGVTRQTVYRYLRTLQSLPVESGPTRSPKQLREFIRRWFGPAVKACGAGDAAKERPAKPLPAKA
jgi:hypothetical protein